LGCATGLVERNDFSMRPARPDVEAASDNPVTVRHDSADHRVGTRRSPPSGRERQRLIHHDVIDQRDIS
jgi:hypothetical protein